MKPSHEERAEDVRLEVTRLLREALAERQISPDALPDVSTAAGRLSVGSSITVELVEAMAILSSGRAWDAVWKVHVALTGSRRHPTLKKVVRKAVPRNMG